MTIERKVGMGIAGQPSGGPTDVAEVFSTHLWKGTGYAQTITNGIDLAGEGGLVWIKSRTPYAAHHALLDTERGVTKIVKTSSTASEITASNYLTSFNSTGFSVSHSNEVSYANGDFVSWTFRKKKKFFDVVTWTGNGASSRTIAHGLNGPIGMLIVKRIDTNDSWYVYHRGLDSNAYGRYLVLNSTDAQDGNGSTNYWLPTDSSFGVNSFGNNVNGATYVAYLWADNSAEDAEDQMIKCSSYTGNGSTTGPIVNLGWEPQFVMIKRATGAENWYMFDSMRGIATGGNDEYLIANWNGVADSPNNFVDLNSTGFQIKRGTTDVNGNNDSYIYMAIRAPMMVEPEAATDVFAMYSGGTSQSYPQYLSGFPVDMALHRATTSTNSELATRLLGAGLLQTNSTSAWGASGAYAFDYSNGWFTHGSPTYFTNYKSWMWKRAKGFFDVVSYTGNATVRTIPHSLGVAPEMIWVKADTNDHWKTMTDTGSITSIMDLNGDVESGSSIAYFFGNGSTYTAPTDSVFTIGTQGNVNLNNTKVVAYLFATLAGISKVGNYTGNGSSQTINCGFSAGSRFVLIKRTNAEGSTSNWYIWDSVRGIVSGNDPHLSLNTNAAQVTNDDSIDPHNSGFIVNQVSATNINVSSGTYIFYAIA